jgi:DNA adenine methylase
MAYLRPLIKWPGGKRYLYREIRRCAPVHHRYVEPFAGGLNELFNKPRSCVEVGGDLNSGLISLYRVVRDRSAEFIARITPIVYSWATFARAHEPEAGGDEIEEAVRFLVRHRFSRGGLAKTFGRSGRLRGGRLEYTNAWETIKLELPRHAERLQGVELLCQYAFDMIGQYDSPQTLFYLDPPYLPETRTARRVYADEMNQEDHERLLDIVLGCQGMVILSGYASLLYDGRLASWERLEFERPNHSGQGKTKQSRTEVLWLNPNCV